MSDPVERPFVLMRHHAGWANVFHVEAEDARSITGAYVDRAEGPATFSTRAILARFATVEAARAACEAAIAEWRKHDDAVHDANAALRAVERAREAAWLACLRAVEG